VLCGVWLAGPAAAGDVIERVLADIDGRPVLLSEVTLVERLRGLDRKAALEAAIDARLMYREAARVPQARISEAEAQQACQSLERKAGALAAGLAEAELCALARREAMVVKYIDFRFAPRLRPGGEPESEAEAEQKLTERIEEWVRELRAAAQTRYTP
jgi:hypothetical protein